MDVSAVNNYKYCTFLPFFEVKYVFQFKIKIYTIQIGESMSKKNIKIFVKKLIYFSICKTYCNKV